MAENTIPKRSEVAEEFTWNLRDFFESDEKWAEEYEALKSVSTDIAKFEGHLGESAETLLSFFRMDDEVSDFVFQSEVSKEFLRRTQELITFLIPQYIEEGKHTFTVAIGCTGGRHRSIAVASALCESIRALGYPTELINRDLEK